jgi:hypothetical protein
MARAAAVRLLACCLLGVVSSGHVSGAAKAAVEAIPPDKICAYTGAPFVGPCFTIRGRLYAGADNISVRIWRIGTHRILGYPQRGLPCDIPPELKPALRAEKTIYADVTVRPVTASEPGVMQLVCIVSATNVSIQD